MYNCNLSLYTTEEKLPNAGNELFIILHDGTWYVAKFSKDNKYGGMFVTHDKHIEIKLVRMWAYQPWVFQKTIA